AASLHRAQQSVLQLEPQRAYGQPAGRHLPIRLEPLCGLAAAGLDRGASYHRRGVGAQHSGAVALFQEGATMSLAIQTELKEHAPVANEARGLEEKVSVRRLNFYYGAYRALADINVNLYKNRVTAFIGPSGCGKSTLLRILNRMYDLYPGQRAEGEVLLDGQNILSPGQDLNLLRAKVGMVFQKPTPFPMTIYDNIAFGVRLYERLGKAEMDARVEDALRRAALWEEVKEKLDASGLSLSGGQQQRLCIARTVAIRPEVILLDEPCSALDPISTAKIEELIDVL